MFERGGNRQRLGTGFVVWFLSSLAPRLLGVDLKAESKKLEAKLEEVAPDGLAATLQPHLAQHAFSALHHAPEDIPRSVRPDVISLACVSLTSSITAQEKIPGNACYGVQTARALENFQLQFVNSEGRMIANLVASLRQNPELAVFLTLALGFLLGRVRVGTFKLGNVGGTLLAGVLIGQLAIKVHPLVEIVFFDLFPLRHRLQGGPAILPWAQEERGTATLADGSLVCDEPRGDGRGGEGARV